MKQDHPTNKDTVKFLKLLKMASEGGMVELFALDFQKNIIAGNIDPFEYETEFSSIDDEIDLSERVCILENFFGHEINVPEQITENEYYQLRYASQIIEGDENEFT